MWLKLFYGVVLYIMLHIIVWFSSNLQFMKNDWASKSLYISLALSVPATLCAYFATKNVYYALYESAWSARFVGFGISYLVFPFLTWWLLKESMLTPKTIVCVALSVLIICIQIFWK